MDTIKYILWDVDRTLIDFDYAEKEALKKCYAEYGFGELTDELLEEYKIINDGYWLKLEKGEITRPELLVNRFKDFFALHGIDQSFASSFNQDYLSSMGDIAHFTPHAEETIKALKGHFKQYAASNGTVEAQRKKLAKSGLDVLLDDVFISGELGVDKPSIEYFQEVFRRVGSANLDGYVIIGDSITSDIMGGKRAGIKTIWYNPHNHINGSDCVPDYEIHDLIEVLNILPIKSMEKECRE